MTENRSVQDKEEVIACYLAMYGGMIRKDIRSLEECLDESYVLIHMTGESMDRQAFFQALLDGTLNYYRCSHEHLPVQIDGERARLRGDTKVEAAVYGGRKHVWRLRLDCAFRKKDGKWKMTKSAASAY